MPHSRLCPLNDDRLFRAIVDAHLFLNHVESGKHSIPQRDEYAVADVFEGDLKNVGANFLGIKFQNEITISIRKGDLETGFGISHAAPRRILLRSPPLASLESVR